MTCPIGMPEGLCKLCGFSKEGLCDYPYEVNKSKSEVKEWHKEGKTE